MARNEKIKRQLEQHETTEEIADSSLRNAPRSVSRATTSFRDDVERGLLVLCWYCRNLPKRKLFFYTSPEGAIP